MKNKTDRKNEIISDSIELMYLRGYNGTSVKDITDAAGIPKGSFYNYFSDKEQYAIDALDYYYTVMVKDKIDLLKDDKLKPLDRIREFYRSGIENLEQKGLKFGCFAGNLSEEMGDVSDSIAKAAAEFHSCIVSKILKNLIQATEEGTLSKNVDLGVLASFIVSSWQGAMLRMKTTNDSKVLDEFYTILDKDLLR